MRFVHLADVHLGASPDSDKEWAAGRAEEIWQSFYRVLDWCGMEQIDLLLIAGDLFHRQPLVRELKELNYRFSRLSGTKVVLIAGNHDSIGPNSAYAGFPWSDNVVMLDNSEMDSVYLEDLNTEVYGFSYHTRDIYEARCDSVRPGVEERINILLAHGGDERDVPMDRKRMVQAGFDYIALGHIHKPEMMGERMAYCGSLEPLDKTEGGEHGFVLGEIEKEDAPESGEASGQNDPTSRITLTFVPFCSRQYIDLSILSDAADTNASMLDKTLERMKEKGEENMFRLVLTGVRDREMEYRTEEFMRLGRVVQVTDETRPDYDFDELARENADNIIGMYIERIRSLAGGNQPLADKALYYGIDALMQKGRLRGSSDACSSSGSCGSSDSVRRNEVAD